MHSIKASVKKITISFILINILLLFVGCTVSPLGVMGVKSKKVCYEESKQHFETYKNKLTDILSDYKINIDTE